MTRDALDVKLDRDLNAAVVAYTTALALSTWECAYCGVESPRPATFSRAQLQSVARPVGESIFDFGREISFATWDLAIYRAEREGLFCRTPDHKLTVLDD